MSITAIVQDDTIKLPPGVHLPNGTKVVINASDTSAERPPMSSVPDFVARQEAAGMKLFDAEQTALLDKLISC
jgi:hypothetical protein